MSSTNQNIELYKSLFRFYGVHCERDGKSGYMPAYEVDCRDIKNFPRD